MFNVEPEEKITAEELAAFEQHVAQRQRRVIKSATLAGIALLVNIFCLIPFLEGFFLHTHWEHFGRYLLNSAGVLLLLFVYRAGSVWASWQAARETRREFRDPD